MGERMVTAKGSRLLFRHGPGLEQAAFQYTAADSTVPCKAVGGAAVSCSTADSSPHLLAMPAAGSLLHLSLSCELVWVQEEVVHCLSADREKKLFSKVSAASASWHPSHASAGMLQFGAADVGNVT